MIVPNWQTGEERGRLDEIAVECGTDKSSSPPNGHGYTRWYPGLFADLCADRKDEPLRLLEIGIGQGAHSLKMWERYLPTADITGADIRPEAVASATGRAKAILCDCGNFTALAASFAGQQFDVIIDDGSHRSDDVFTALNFFWPLLRPGGWYAVEDLCCQTEDYFTDETPPIRIPISTASFPDRMRLAFMLLRARRLQILPSQLRFNQGTGGQCLAILHK